MPLVPTAVTDCQTCGSGAMATGRSRWHGGERWPLARCPHCNALIPYRLGPAAERRLTTPGPVVQVQLDHERLRLVVTWARPDADPSGEAVGARVLDVASGSVVELALPGARRWTLRAAGEGLAVATGVEPTIPNGRSALRRGAPVLAVFDTEDGSLRWERALAAPCRAVVAAGMIGLDPIALPADAAFEVLDAATGTAAAPVHRAAFRRAWAAAHVRRPSVHTSGHAGAEGFEGDATFERWAPVVAALLGRPPRRRLRALHHEASASTVLDLWCEGAGGALEEVVLVVRDGRLRWWWPIDPAVGIGSVALVGDGRRLSACWIEGGLAVITPSVDCVVAVPLGGPDAGARALARARALSEVGP